MRLIDPTKTQTTVTDSEHGRDRIKYTEHHDGTVDATVKIKAIKIVSGAPVSKPLIEAVAELESATREWRVAKHSTSEDWKQHVKTRLRVANEKVQAAQ